MKNFINFFKCIKAGTNGNKACIRLTSHTAYYIGLMMAKPSRDNFRWIFRAMCGYNDTAYLWLHIVAIAASIASAVGMFIAFNHSTITAK